MFGNKRNYNDIFRAFDEMFAQFDLTQGEWKSKTRVSDDGAMKVTTYYRGGDSSKSEEGIDRLKRKLQIAIEEENFEEAVKLRDEIKTYESNQDSINKLEMELKKSIEEQDFEKSIDIRDQLKKLKM
jgi:protein-arginine kinase activator protein McsA